MGPGPGPGRGRGQGPGPGPLGTGKEFSAKTRIFMNICLECDSKHAFQKVDKQTKPLCPKESHRNSVLGGGLKSKNCLMWSRTHQPNWDLTNLGQNVNLNFQNDAAADGDGAGTTHPSWWVPREHHAQGSNIPFGYPSL